MKRILFIIPFLFLFSNSPTSNDMGISIETNSKIYRPGQSVKINIKLKQASYLYILTLQSDGNINLLYPNEEEQENMVFNEEIRIPDEKKDYEFLAGDRIGKDIIIGIASRNRIKKLHKSKYWSKPVLKGMNPSNMAWLKKLTKRLPQDQWVSAETPIFISKDGVTESNGVPTKKESKIITPSSTDVIPTDFKKDLHDFQQNEVLYGLFKLPSSVRNTENKKGSLLVMKDPDLNTYKLRVTPYLTNPKDFCDYSIVSFTNPRKVSSTYASIEVVPGECSLKEVNAEQKDFWKKITNFYIQYQYKKNGALKGNVWMIAQDGKYNQKMSKFAVKDEFKFLE
ncbi:MAG TPA: DUF4384 domain-containing protein [Leptospiraceae bacterium]|nr:DUF4384 domain-containing protein [Leptospiraceae bacterium]HMW04564.1 DUF4384 domain-containing protein [Leptospiraceae bacterium]HMX33441.1 DUF4384 domain-containing protein [Leptospiraceae bacterium]HMY30750.1 DUF4384 domain-containing protein [Leptospiraceae bacterium]HMZ64328.1 DUF4384 domain-containing protein [Leptospiraceae bacterium]